MMKKQQVMKRQDKTPEKQGNEVEICLTINIYIFLQYISSEFSLCIFVSLLLGVYGLRGLSSLNSTFYH